MVEMIIIWSVVIAVALLIEFFTYDLVTGWFAFGGLGALIMAAARVDIWWQLLVFFIIPLLCLLFLRRFVLRFVRVPTTPTNLDAKVGCKFKLLKDVKEGRSEIKINDIIWTVSCPDDLKEGDEVQITGMEGNRYLVRDPSSIIELAATDNEPVTAKKNKKVKEVQQ